MKKFLSFLPVILILIITTEGFLISKSNKLDHYHQVNRTLENEIKITILYDNYSAKPGTNADWGFACLIEGTEKTILFDTGAKGDILINNIDKLGVDLKKVDLIVISHDHGDHTGGIKAVLQRNPELPVYVTKSFPKELENKLGIKKINRIDKSVEICKDVISTGEMGAQIAEQSLVLNTAKGLIIITGCSHQGIVNILNKAKEMYNKEIYLVFGGFHLLRESKKTMDEIINSFEKIGVQKCGATHCTGDAQIKQFKEAFKDNYVEMGTGKILLINNNGLEVK